MVHQQTHKRHLRGLVLGSVLLACSFAFLPANPALAEELEGVTQQQENPSPELENEQGYVPDQTGNANQQQGVLEPDLTGQPSGEGMGEGTPTNENNDPEQGNVQGNTQDTPGEGETAGNTNGDTPVTNQEQLETPATNQEPSATPGDNINTNNVVNENGAGNADTPANQPTANQSDVVETLTEVQGGLGAQNLPRQGRWQVTSSRGHGLQRYWIWNDDNSLAKNELIGPENGAGYYAWAGANGVILRGKWDNGHGRVYAADNDGRLIGSKIGDEDGWVVTADYDGHLERYWVDHVTRAAVSGFFTVEGYGDSFGLGGQGYVHRGDFAFAGRLWSADNDGRLRSGWYVTSGFGQGTQRYWMGDQLYGSPHAAAVSRLIDPNVDGSNYYAWATDAGYVLRGKWDNGHGRVYAADNDGKLIGNKIGDEDGWVVTADYDGHLERYWVDHVTRAAVSGFFTVEGYGDSFGMGGHGYVVRGALPFMGKVVLADNDGKLPKKEGWVVTSKYAQGLQRYYIEKIFVNYLGAVPGYSEAGYPHYTTAAGYVLRNGYVAENGKAYKADNDGRAEEIKVGWFKMNGHWVYISADERAHFDNDIDENGNDLGNYDILHDIWLYVNGYVSGSRKSFLSKTEYLICSAWDQCYVAIFKGTPNSSKADNWEPLFGWNCANGKHSVIEGKVKEKNPGSTWKWDPNWDKFLGEANTRANRPELPDENRWAASLDTTWAGTRRASVSAGEKWFTSVSWTLGYHTYLTNASELGKHMSNGCQRLAYENAKWIYDNVGPGTRCLQRTFARLKNG